jgi:hypothetical protein
MIFDLGYWMDLLLPWFLIALCTLTVLIALIWRYYILAISLVFLLIGCIFMFDPPNWMFIDFNLSEGNSFFIGTLIFVLGLIGAIKYGPSPIL